MCLASLTALVPPLLPWSGRCEHRRRGRLANYQLDWEHLAPRWRGRFLQSLEQQLDAEPGHPLDRGADGGQPWLHILTEPDVVEPNDGQVIRHSDAVRLG